MTRKKKKSRWVIEGMTEAIREKKLQMPPWNAGFKGGAQENKGANIQVAQSVLVTINSDTSFTSNSEGGTRG